MPPKRIKKPKKAKLSRDPDAWWESIHIQDAFRILSPRLFGIWVTMHTLNPRHMVFGTTKLADVFGLSRPGFTKSIHLLRDAGFISVERSEHFQPVTIRLLKRASICNSSWFVNVPSGKGRMKLTHEEEDEKVELYGRSPKQVAETAKERALYRARKARQVKKAHNNRERINNRIRLAKRKQANSKERAADEV